MIGTPATRETVIVFSFRLWREACFVSRDGKLNNPRHADITHRRDYRFRN